MNLQKFCSRRKPCKAQVQSQQGEGHWEEAELVQDLRRPGPTLPTGAGQPAAHSGLCGAPFLGCHPPLTPALSHHKQLYSSNCTSTGVPHHPSLPSQSMGLRCPNESIPETPTPRPLRSIPETPTLRPLQSIPDPHTQI
ncbi:hypothetical protein P7K49_002180 [Saguinus oedipus]|uniref:Uncharacterized protein n=1 Tax=Saguinus oedipus TaxID=9490 RepID=A0ABQ9WGL6_SAGOE|nr:hypothetical protein P7K49_002180 [Saguinus oedipus]